MSKRFIGAWGVPVIGATLVLGAGVAGASTPGTSPGAFIGPRTRVSPYAVPVDAANTQITSLLTVDDLPAANGYPMAGIPDGLGGYAEGGNVTFLSNHELNNTQGIARPPLPAGAFVSKWTLNPATLDVVAGKDAITSVDYAGTTPGVFSRFCSADLATAQQLYNPATGNGYNGDLFLNGEEAGAEGRAVATDPVSGAAWVLPALGRMSWENALAATTANDATVVMDTNDTTPTAGRGSANFIYVGTKTNTGAPHERAGLTNGSLYGIVVDGASTEAAFRASKPVGTAVPFTVVPVVGTTGAALQVDATAKGVYAPDRSEDGAWDPSSPNDFYFVTTGSTPAANGRGGLWRQRFNDVNNPQAGGTLTLLVDHATTHAATDNSTNQPRFYMPDNIAIDTHGHILIQEDPGADDYVARVFAYDIATNQLKAIATFDPARFAPGPGLITNDEESSGVIDTEPLLGPGTFLFDAQVHTSAGLSNVTRDVERGQYLVAKVDFARLFGGPEPVIAEAPFPALLGLGGLGAVGGYFALRRRTRSRA